MARARLFFETETLPSVMRLDFSLEKRVFFVLHILPNGRRVSCNTRTSSPTGELCLNNKQKMAQIRAMLK
jgi:hypothetical protein